MCFKRYVKKKQWKNTEHIFKSRDRWEKYLWRKRYELELTHSAAFVAYVFWFIMLNFICYWQVVKQALLFTLSQELRELFTDECRKAWELTFDILADAMATGMVANSNDD